MNLTSFLTKTFRSGPGRPEPESGPVMRVAICGEVSAGKSTVLNALLRAPVFADNIGSLRRPFIHVRHGSHGWAEVHHPDGEAMVGPKLPELSDLRGAARIELWSPQSHLSGFEFVEVPLTTAEDLTEAQRQLIGSSQIMVWVTIASQAWRLTEQTLVERLGDARPKHSVIAVSRADKLHTAEDRDRVQARLERETGHIFQTGVFIDGSKMLISGAISDEKWNQSAAPQLLETLRSIRSEIAPDAEAHDDDGTVTMVYRGKVHRKPGSPGGAAGKKSKPKKYYRGVAYDDDDDETEAEAPVQAQSAAPSQTAAPGASSGWANSRHKSQDHAILDPARTLAPPAPEPAPVPSPAAASAPAAPAPASAARKSTGVDMPRATLAAGLIPHDRPGECDVFSGDVQRCQATAKVVAEAMERIERAYDFIPGYTGPISSVSMSTSGHRLLCEEVPGQGIAFILLDGQHASHGTANAAFARLCESLVTAG